MHESLDIPTSLSPEARTALADLVTRAFQAGYGEGMKDAQRAAEQAMGAAIDAAAQREREACARVCDEIERANLYGVKECAAAIRSRSI